MLDHLTTEDLIARLAQIEKLGKGPVARIEAGERTGRILHGLNWQRLAWRNTIDELDRRQVDFNYVGSRHHY